jgi:hypothetical protein
MLWRMSGIDLTTAETHLQTWLAAEQAVALGQSVSHGTRSLTRANLAEIRDSIRFWQRQIHELSSASGVRAQQVIFYG